ncbi:MAG: hypothetical protein QXQ87_04295 [Halobacteria archaeon]
MGTRREATGLARVLVLTAVTVAALAAASAPADASTPWLNASWHYRVPFEVNTSGAPREDWPVEFRVNFTPLLDKVGGANRTFDINSVRLVEYNNTTKELLTYNSSYTATDSRRYFAPVQFERCDILEPWCGYDNTTNANGTVVWLLNGTTAANTARHYLLYFDAVESHYPGGSSPKAAFDYGSASTFNRTGMSSEIFRINTSKIMVDVDTNRSNLSGIVRVGDTSLAGADWNSTVICVRQAVEGDCVTADGENPIEFTNYTNGATGQSLSYDLRGNWSWVIDGPVRKVAEQRGPEFAGFPENRTNDFNLTKRYYFYNQSRHIKIEQNLTNVNNTTLSRNNTGFKCYGNSRPCPEPLAFRPQSDDSWVSASWAVRGSENPGEPLSKEWGRMDVGGPGPHRIVGLVNLRDLGDPALENQGITQAPRGYRTSSVGANDRFGVAFYNTTFQPGESIFDVAAVAFGQRATVLASPADTITDELQNNFTNPPTVNGLPLNESLVNFTLLDPALSFERWLLNQSAEANNTTFNRGETVRLAANVTNDSVWNHTANARVSNYTLNASATSLLNRTGNVFNLAWNTTSGRWELDYTVGDDNATGDWNFTARVNDSAGQVLNLSSRVFNITSVYKVFLDFVDVFYYENTTDTGSVPVILNDSLNATNVTVRNFRNDAGIAGIALTDSGLYCDINATAIPTANRSETGGGVYRVNFTRNETFAKYWNLSCGAVRNNNTGNASQVFKTEPPGVNVTIDMSPQVNTTSEINEVAGNTTYVNVTTFNEGNGTAILANVTVSAPPGWVVRNTTGANITGLPVNVTGYHLANRTYFNLTNVSVFVPAGTMPGNYTINASVSWMNLNRTFRYNTDNTTITVLSNPVLNITGANDTTNPALNASDAVLPVVLGPASVEHNNLSYNFANFTINASGNDDLRLILFQNASVSGSNLETLGITLSFNNSTGNASGMNLSAGGRVHIRVNLTIPKGHAAGTYWAHYNVTANGSLAGTQCANFPERCRKQVNLSVTIPENRTWSVTRAIPATIAAPSNNTTTAAGNLTVVHEGNLPLDFTVDDLEPGAPWVSNVSESVLNFSIQPAGQQVVQVNYTIKGNQSPGTYEARVRVFSNTAGSTNIATGNNSSNQSILFDVADIQLPVVSNVSFDGNTTPAAMALKIVDVLQGSILIGANVTDNFGVNRVYANITLPNASFQNITLPRIGVTDGYEANFTPPALNGTYTVVITAFDNNTTANVNTSAALGTFTFNASNGTNGTLGTNPTVFQAENVTSAANTTFNLAFSFENTGPGTAFNSNISAFVNNSTALALGNTTQGCGNLARGSTCTRYFTVTVLANAFNGTYRVDAYLNWTHANGTGNPPVANNTTIQVWKNPLLNLSDEAPFVANLTLTHNVTGTYNFTVFSRGNHPPEQVNFSQVWVNASGSSLIFSFNATNFNLSAGANRSVGLNVTVPAGHPIGTWQFAFEANTSNTVTNATCAAAERCKKTFNLSVQVVPDRSWALNDSTAVNVTCGSADNRIQVDLANSTLCEIKVNNTGNVNLTFNATPAWRYINTTQSKGNLTVNRTQFVINRSEGPKFFNITLDTLNVTPGIYNITFAVNATDNDTSDSGQPLLRNLTVNLTVFTKPLIALVNATTPNETAPVAVNTTEAGKHLLVVEQGASAAIFVNVTDNSGSSNTGIREVQANVTRPDGTSAVTVSTQCVALCAVTANNNSTWRILVPGANLTARGNNTVNLTAVDNLSNPSDPAPVTLRVKPKLVQVLNISKTGGGAPATDYGPNDNVFWNVYVPDLLGFPVAGANATVTFRDPLGDPVQCSTNVSSGTTSAAGTVELRCKLTAAPTGTYTWNVSLNYTDVANNTTSLNSTAGSLQVKAADLFVTLDAGGPWKPGDLMTFTASTKDQNLQTLGTGAVTVRVELYYPNGTLYLSQPNLTFLPGPELWSGNLSLGTAIPFGAVGSPNSTYFAKAIANKTGSNTTVNDSKVVYVTDTLTATLSVGTPQFNNSTMNASFLVFRSGNILVDPDSFALNVTSAAGALLTGGNCQNPVWVTNISGLPANVQRLGTGFFLVQCQLQAAQPQGFYKANLSVNRSGVSAGDLRAFEIALSSLDVNVEVLSQTPTNLSFRATIVNPGATGPSDITAEYEVTVNPTVAAGTQACLIKPFATTVCPTITVAPPQAGNYNIRVTVSGPGVNTVTVNRQVAIGAAPPPAQPAAPAGAGGAGGAGGAFSPGAPERAVLDVEAPADIEAVRGYRLNYSFTVANRGETSIPALNFTLQGVPRAWWSVAAENGGLDLPRGQVKRFVLTLLIPPDAERGRLSLSLVAEGAGERDAAPLLLTVYGDWSEIIPETLRRVNDTLSELRRRAAESESSGANVSGVLPLLGQAGELLAEAREAYLNRDFEAASIALERARTLLDRANAGLAAAPREEAVPVTPQTVILAIVGVLAAAAFGVAVWTGQIARSLSRTARGLVLGAEARPAPLGPQPGAAPPPPGPAAKGPLPPASPAPGPPPPDPLAERMSRARESTERLVNSLREQMEKGLISKERYEELVRKIRR